MKYSGLKTKLAALRALLPPPGGVTLRIEGGLGPDYAPAKPEPPGGDLKAQHRMFGRPRGATEPTAVPNTPEPATEPPQPAKRVRGLP